MADVDVGFTSSYVLATPGSGVTFNTIPIWLGAAPMMADDGNIVWRHGEAPNSPIVLYSQKLAPVATIANASQGFTALGRVPGISDDGRFVAFYGDLGAAGATALGMKPGPGIFLSYQSGSGRVIKRLAGLTGTDGSALFRGFDGNQRIGVNGPQQGDRAVAVFVATDAGGAKGVWICPFDARSTEEQRPTAVVRQSDQIDGVGPFDGFELLDPINTQGKVAFLAATSSGQALVIAAQQQNPSASLGSSIELVSSSAPVLPGKDVAVTITIRNDGPDAALGTLLAEIFLTADGQLGDSALILKTTSLPIALSAGASQSLQLPITLLSGSSPGMDHAGLRKLVLRINADNAFSDVKSGQALSISPCFWMGQVINVVTHGFNPNPLDDDWLVFRGVGYSLAQTMNKIPQPGSVLENRVTFYISKWESRMEFFGAFFTLLAAKYHDAYAMDAEDRLSFAAAIAARKVAQNLKEAARSHVRNSSRYAADAATKIFNDLRSQYLLDDADLASRYQHIHLIGHSRGAAVNARVSKLLFSKNYKVAEYTALDGFSTDWPDDGGTIGDIDIAEETVADVKVNYLVEQDLAAAIALAKVQVGQVVLEVQVILDGLALVLSIANDEQVVAFPGFSPGVTHYLTTSFNLRAPARESSGFKDVMLLGLGGSSQHLNIITNYDYSGRRSDIEQQYVLQNFVGSNRATRCDEIVPYSDNANQIPIETETSLPSPPAISDGSFEQIPKWQLPSSATNIITDDPYVDGWRRVFQDPTLILSLVWRSSGNVLLESDSTNTFATLTGTSTNTFLGQPVFLSLYAKSLLFDLAVKNPERNSKMQVWFTDKLLGELPLTASGGFKRQTMDLAGATGAGDLFFRLIGPTNAPAVISLDNIALTYTPLKIVSAQITQATNLTFVIDAKADSFIVVEASLDLKSWGEIALREALADRYQFSISEPPNRPQRFYRLRVLE